MGYDNMAYCLKCEYKTPGCACPQPKPTMLAMQHANGEAKRFKKFDNGKAQWHLMPEEALVEVLNVLQQGAKKYGDFNWLDNAAEVDLVRYQNALERHLKSFKRGTDLDAESGLYEMAHIACNALFILTMQIKKLGTDSRRKD